MYQQLDVVAINDRLLSLTLTVISTPYATASSDISEFPGTSEGQFVRIMFVQALHGFYTIISTVLFLLKNDREKKMSSNLRLHNSHPLLVRIPYQQPQRLQPSRYCT